VDQRSAERLEELSRQETSRSVLGHLACSPRDDVLVALAAGLGVVGRSEAVFDGFGLLRFYASQGCKLGAVNRSVYAELPDEIQLLWYKDLTPRG
jgi:hypothetical protein